MKCRVHVIVSCNNHAVRIGDFLIFCQSEGKFIFKFSWYLTLFLSTRTDVIREAVTWSLSLNTCRILQQLHEWYLCLHLLLCCRDYYRGCEWNKKVLLVLANSILFERKEQMLEYFDYDIRLEAVTKHISEFFNVSNSGVYLYSSPDFHPGISG